MKRTKTKKDLLFFGKSQGHGFLFLLNTALLYFQKESRGMQGKSHHGE